MAHSLPFIQYDAERGLFTVNEDAAAYLSTLEENIGGLLLHSARCAAVRYCVLARPRAFHTRPNPPPSQPSSLLRAATAAASRCS